MRVDVRTARPRHVRVGRLLVVLSRTNRDTPLVDGAGMSFRRAIRPDTGPGEHVVEDWRAGGVRVRLCRRRPGWHALAPAVDVGWRGRRVPNPRAWPLTSRGRAYRRMLRTPHEGGGVAATAGR